MTGTSHKHAEATVQLLTLWYEQKRPFSPSCPYSGRLRQSASSQRLLTTSTMPISLCAAQNLEKKRRNQQAKKQVCLHTVMCDMYRCMQSV